MRSKEVIAVLSFLIALGTSGIAYATSIQTYTNPIYGFEIGVPSGWQIEENTDPSDPVKVLMFSDVSGASVNVVFSPDTGMGNTKSEIRQFAMDVVQELFTSEDSVQIEEGVECETFSIGGGPACSTVLSANDQFGNSRTLMQIVSIVGGNGYFVTFAAPSENFENQRQLFIDIWETFAVNYGGGGGGGNGTGSDNVGIGSPI